MKLFWWGRTTVDTLQEAAGLYRGRPNPVAMPMQSKRRKLRPGEGEHGHHVTPTPIMCNPTGKTAYSRWPIQQWIRLRTQDNPCSRLRAHIFNLTVISSLHACPGRPATALCNGILISDHNIFDQCWITFRRNFRGISRVWWEKVSAALSC